MWRYAIRRLSFLPIILFLVSVLTFMLLRVLPGQDLADVIGGPDATPEQRQQIRERYGFARPIFPISAKSDVPFVSLNKDSQYSDWVLDALRGDFGRTFRSQAPVIDEFSRRFWPSFELVALSLFFSAVFGITFGILSAMFRNTLLDYVVRVFAVFGTSIPEFFLLTLLIIIPSFLWNYSMPVGGYVPIHEDPWNNLRLFLPATLVIGIGGAAGLMRLVRTTMLEVLRGDYIRTARSKGLHEQTVILTHALRNAGTPIMTALGGAFVAVFGGSIIAERILSIQGNGLLFFESAFIRDLPVVQFFAVYTAAVVVIVNLLVDLSYAYIDPRVKYS